ncbi:hypothetical protein QQZ08_004414 [Neonectria magnoliae]|uniref:ATPase AAA-type core domain-containing protein n=1 Tax=Neonectria magnoliae TaxID=2732573 RepID=A0ABR1I7V3_9HYPO
MVSALLSPGADPLIIPSDLLTPYARDPPTGPQKDENEVEISPLTDWCTDETRTKLAKVADITQRYYLECATKIKKPSKKRRQIAKLKNAEGLLGVPYFLIGQSNAPILRFAEPSGHDKTELARQLGHLLSLDLEVVDCTIARHEMELFGPRAPYHGSRQGSPVNNFLAEHSGQRCIVVMDKFEKTAREIHQALLLPFDNGEYQDRRDHGEADCSNTIWILATNALDDEILDFCEQNEALFGENDEEKLQLTKKLSRELLDAFLRYFSAHYHKKLGARSLVAGAKKVERIVLDAYLDEDEEIRENEGLRDFIIDVQEFYRTPNPKASLLGSEKNARSEMLAWRGNKSLQL